MNETISNRSLIMQFYHCINLTFSDICSYSEKSLKCLLRPLFKSVLFIYSISKLKMPAKNKRFKKNCMKRNSISSSIIYEGIITGFYKFSTKFFDSDTDNASERCDGAKEMLICTENDRIFSWDFSYVPSIDSSQPAQRFIKRTYPDDNQLTKLYVKIYNHLLIHFELEYIKICSDILVPQDLRVKAQSIPVCLGELTSSTYYANHEEFSTNKHTITYLIMFPGEFFRKHLLVIASSCISINNNNFFSFPFYIRGEYKRVFPKLGCTF